MLKKTINIFFFSFVIFVAGCGLFNLRDAENPVDPRSNFIPPTTPDIVITNFVSAITERNLNNYLQCFVDSNFSTRRFSFTADALSQQQYPIFRYWNLNNERYYFTSLISQTSPSATSYLFLSNVIINPSSDTSVYDADYLLRFDHNAANIPHTLKGKMRLILGVDTRNLWSIHNWIDLANPSGDTTWSFIKAGFSN